jgi:hypothetical protein
MQRSLLSCPTVYIGYVCQIVIPTDRSKTETIPLGETSDAPQVSFKLFIFVYIASERRAVRKRLLVCERVMA